MYCTMGWMGAFLAFFLFPYIGWGGIVLIAAGGIFYTVRLMMGFPLRKAREPFLHSGRDLKRTPIPTRTGGRGDVSHRAAKPDTWGVRCAGGVCLRAAFSSSSRALKPPPLQEPATRSLCHLTVLLVLRRFPRDLALHGDWGSCVPLRADVLCRFALRTGLEGADVRT